MNSNDGRCLPRSVLDSVVPMEPVDTEWIPSSHGLCVWEGSTLKVYPLSLVGNFCSGVETATRGVSTGRTTTSYRAVNKAVVPILIMANIQRDPGRDRDCWKNIAGYSARRFVERSPVVGIHCVARSSELVLLSLFELRLD